MEAKSFKQMIQAGEIKRADAMKIQLDDIHEEPGFNLRDEGEDLEASISALAAHIMAGGMVPALEVRPRPAGGVSAAIAVKMAREHGEGAGQVLQQELDKAKAAGKGKVTGGTIKGKALPEKVITPLVDAVDSLLEGLAPREHEELASIRNGSTATNATVLVPGKALLDSHQALVDARKAQEAKAREKAAKAAQVELAEGGAA